MKHSPVNKMQNSPCVSCLLVFPVSPRSCLLSQVTNNKQMRPLVPLVTQSLATVMSDNTPCLHPPHILDTRSPVSCHCLPHGCIMLVEKKNVWQNLGKEEFGSNSDRKLEPVWCFQFIFCKTIHIDPCVQCHCRHRLRTLQPLVSDVSAGSDNAEKELGFKFFAS